MYKNFRKHEETHLLIQYPGRTTIMELLCDICVIYMHPLQEHISHTIFVLECCTIGRQGHYSEVWTLFDIGCGRNVQDGTHRWFVWWRVLFNTSWFVYSSGILSSISKAKSKLMQNHKKGAYKSIQRSKTCLLYFDKYNKMLRIKTILL